MTKEEDCPPECERSAESDAPSELPSRPVTAPDADLDPSGEPRSSGAPSARPDPSSDPSPIATAGRFYDEGTGADLIPALERLDDLLRGAVDVMEATLGADRPMDRFRGLYVTLEDVERSLSGVPGAAGIFGSREGSGAEESGILPDGDGSALGWLSQSFGLEPFDVNVLLLALAPETDLKYERVYAFLQDNVTRTRPTVELALNLLCRSAEEKFRRMERFREGAPLVRHGLVELIPDPSAVHPPLLAHFLRVDPQISAFILGTEGVDSRLSALAELTDPEEYLDELTLAGTIVQELSTLLDHALETGEPLRLYLRGPGGAGRSRVAAAIAAESGMRLLTVSTDRLLAAETDPRRAVRLAFRKAWLGEAVILWKDADRLLEGGATSLLEAFLAELRKHEGFSVLAGREPWVPSPETPVGIVTLDLVAPDYDQRYALWESSADEAGIALAESEIALLAGRFELTAAQIADAVAVARQRIHRIPEDVARPDTPRIGPEPPPHSALEHVLAAARAQTGHELAKLTRRIEPVYRKADIVLPEETMRRLDEICARVSVRHTVLDEWGWDAKLSLGKGTSALLSGPSGSGKTMAAEVIAAELGLELFRIDLATVLDKYIGETEKKLEKIFEAAEASNSVLLFDEADALFGKRSEVRDSHDRYANVEISYLLQKIEEYDGLAILATNLPQNLDEAFTRRLTFTVRFPAPDARSRRLIWEKIWPARTPLAEDVDLDFLAREYRLTGGNIKNIAMAASFYAAEERTRVTMEHILRATRREFEQMGKVVAAAGPGRAPGEGPEKGPGSGPGGGSSVGSGTASADRTELSA